MLPIHRVYKSDDFTVMANSHFKNADMSLKAKGMLSQMLSLPDGWDFSIQGLMTLTSDGRDCVRTTLKELERFGYLKRTPVKEAGKIVDWCYDIYEVPLAAFPQVGKPTMEKPQVGNQPQLNTNKSNTKESRTKKFIPPTIEEVTAYAKQLNSGVDPNKFWSYFDAGNWHDSEGKPVKSWKQKFITWDSKTPKPTPQQQQPRKSHIEIINGEEVTVFE